MKKTCINCKYKDIDYTEYPCCECNNKSRWEKWQDTNYQPTVEDLIIEELEKIKYEMLLKRDSVDLFQSAFNWNIELIEKHISELKGENK